MNQTEQKRWLKVINKNPKTEPTLIIDLGVVEDKYKDLNKHLKGFGIYYAVKCNPEKNILETLKRLGSHFEIASIGELNRLIEINVNPKEVIYSNPVKPIQHIEDAYKKGVRYFSYDSAEELAKIAKHAPGSNVYLRMSVSNHGSLINLANKFGANKEHAALLISLADDMGLNATGISFHVGSQSENMQLWDQAFDDVVDVLMVLQKQGIELKTLNIGGGFPINYTEKVPTIKEVSKKIRTNLKKLPYEMELLCEPGRYLVGEAGVLSTTIIGKTTRLNQPWVFLDVGRFQFFVEMFESDSLQYPVFTSIDGKESAKPRSLYTITGPSCDSYDTIMRDVSLPTNLQVGDKLYFGSAGAYTHVYGSPFNDFPVPGIVYERNNK